MEELKEQIEETDVLIIGGGGAGLMAALEASKHLVGVTIVTKDSGASPGIVAFNVPLDPRDFPNIHFKDTIDGGACLNNYTLVKVLVNEAREAMTKLESIGMQFEKRNGNYDLLQPLGCTYPRAVHYGNVTGPRFLELMLKEIRQRNVKLRKNVMITSLLVEKDVVTGARGIDMKSGEPIMFKAYAVVLATGGCGQLYLFSTYPKDVTGDGYAMAYETGAELIDMEFLQFEPCGIVYPNQLRGKGMITTLLMEGGELRNIKGERFMWLYDPKGEKAQKDVIAHAIFEEVRAGRGTEHGGVYFDVSMLPENRLVEKYSQYFRRLFSVGIDIRKEPVEVAPIAHSYMGGVKINEKCATSIRGLYAAGEVTGGIHGANRLGGNAGTDILVFGSRAGRFAAEYALSNKRHQLEPRVISKDKRKMYYMKSENKNPVRPTTVKSQIQDIMFTYVNVVKNETGLKEALKNLRMIIVKMLPKMSASDTEELLEAYQVKNMLVTGQMLIKASLRRTESRGAHFREDYPYRDDEKWLRNIIIRKVNGQMKIRTQRIVAEL